jgi:hypothetical protein
MTKRISEMTKQELIWAIEGYAQSARRTFDDGNDPRQTLGRIRSMIEHFDEAPTEVSAEDEALPPA